MSFHTKTVLITGGSSGIGFELAKLFAKENYRILLVSLLEEELAAAKQYLTLQTKGLEVITLQKDLSLISAAQEVYDWVQEHAWELDILVNNAGFAVYGFVDEIDMNRERNMIQLNVLNLYQLTRLFLKEMVQKDAGKIMNISSVTAFQPNPHFATYGATKAFVYNFSRAINFELKERQSKVRVITICPPATRTPFIQAAKMEKTSTFEGFGTLDPEVVARDAFRALKKSADKKVPGRTLPLLFSIFSRLPSKLKMWIVNSQLK